MNKPKRRNGPKKKCNYCKRDVSLLDFKESKRSKDGYSGRCIHCIDIIKNGRECRECGKIKSELMFDVNKSNKCGRNYSCKPCRKIYNEYRKKKKDRQSFLDNYDLNKPVPHGMWGMPVELLAKHQNRKIDEPEENNISVFWGILIAMVIFAGLVAYVITNGFNVNFK